MKSLSRITLVAAFVLAGFLLLSARGYAGPKDTFTALKCTNCHSVTAAKIPAKGSDAHDLSKTGVGHDATWMKGWLQKTEKSKGKAHKVAFKGTDAQLTELATWLATLK